MSNKTTQVDPNRPKNADDSKPNQSPTNGGLPEGQVVWYLIALVVAAVATVVIGYLIGITIEGRNADKDIEANQQQATQAIETREAFATEVALNASSALSDTQSQATAQIATLNAQATAALDSVTQQFEATRDANATSTAVVEAYTTTPTPQIPQAQLLSVLTQVRLGPDAAYPIIGNLSQDTVVDVIGPSEDGLWYQIEYTDEDDEVMTGFVTSQSIRLTGGSLSGLEVVADFPTLTSTPSPTATATYTSSPTSTLIPTFTSTPTSPEASVLSVITTVHVGPGDDYPVIDILNQDSEVSILGTSDDGLWLQVEYDDEIGFVRADTVRLTGGSLNAVEVVLFPTNTPIPEPTIAPTPSSPEAAAAGEFLVIREGPAEVFSTIGVVSANQSLEIIGISTDGYWFQVQFNDGPSGDGWISGQLVRIAGDLTGLPVVQGPPLPNTGVAGASDVTGSGASTSAGSQNPIDPSDLPSSRNNNYDDLDNLNAYAYQFAIAVDGEGDGQPYQLFVTVDYAQALNPDQAIMNIDATGDVENFLGGSDSEFLGEFLPLIVGSVGDVTYFYSQSDEFCFDVGEDIDLPTFRDEFQLTTSQNSIDLLDTFSDSAVYGIVDQNGLVGILGDHYQLLGTEQSGQITPIDGVKADFWWTPDQSVLFGFRVELALDAGNIDLYSDVLATLDVGIDQFNTFEGTVTIYLLPRAIDSSAIDMTTPPDACNNILP